MLCGNLSFCSLAGALFIGSRLVRYHAAESIFTGAAFNNATLLACRFRHCNLGRVKICGSNVGGAEFAHCVLDNVILEEDVFESCSFNCSHFLQAHVSGLRTMSSELLKLCRESYLREASDAGGLELRPPDGRGFELARKALERWQLACDVTFRKMRFMENNRRRMDWSREKFGAEKSKFMKLAPYLLHTEVFEHVNDVPLLPLSSCMANYQPDLTTLEFAREHFGRVELPEHQHDPVNIHGLYTIGSVGSIAQTQSSDMDFWVCYDAEDMPESMAHGLSYKLESIEQWAMEEFGLEVHFFLMDLNLIRNNNFGFSDTESSGSAQALLLKEEFYRTAMHLAGELPIWCVTEPGEKRASSRKLLDSLRKSGLIPDLVDLGGLRSIPREEFFGASLWQIVKALKSPFKSIMKFGLVEKYISAGDGEETPLLCNQLKHNLIEHRQSLMDVDPYMLLFKEVVEHYQQAGDKESMQMVRLSFALKTGLRGQINKREPLMLPEYKEIKDIFSKSDRDSPMHLSSFYISQDWPFDKLVSMGHMVNKFVIRTYSRVREEQSGLEKVAITPEDLTKLGRKIFSTFSKRKNKIEHIPFVSFSEVPFKVLHFSATGGNIGEPEHWEIQGAQEVSTSQRLHLANLRDGDSLPELLAWLTANEIFAPGMHVRGDYSISPVTTRDLSSALLSLRNFFPASKTFNTDIAETLNPERIVRAFFMLNLVKPRESPKIMDVAVIYSTNWGELFCITIQGAGEGLRKDPVEFLRKHTRQDVSEPPVMECFVPTRSKCPPLKLPARV
jgi:adenylate cyclase class 1